MFLVLPRSRHQAFVESECPGKQALRVSCQSLLCGERPQAWPQTSSHWARFVPSPSTPGLSSPPVPCAPGLHPLCSRTSSRTQSATPTLATGRRARIVGGTNSGPGAWPWQAALYKEGEFQCGATLISDRWLLSAGHCFYQ